MSKIRHILFDCDGVLVDTEYIAAVKMCEALAEAGIEVKLEHYLRVHSGTTFSAILEHYFADAMDPGHKADLTHMVEAQVAASVKPVPGIAELLPTLDINKSVVSNSSIATVKHALKATAMSNHFDNRIFSSEQVANAKPAPDLYLFAIKSLALEPEEILVVEDSRTGVRAAVDAGLKVIGFTAASHILPGHDEKLMAMGAGQTVPNAVALEELLRTYLIE
jgi:HAD superfamily hydrolase (TIGR01509 family)